MSRERARAAEGPDSRGRVINPEQAVKDPRGTFDHPHEVVDSVVLSRAEKVEALQRWEQEARALYVATEENMTEDAEERLHLHAVHEALRALRATPPDRGSATKAGG